MDTRLTPPRKEKDLRNLIHSQVEALRRMTVRELRLRYREVFGEESRSNHKAVSLPAHRLAPPGKRGGRAVGACARRALEIANDGELRIRAPKDFDFDGAGQRCVHGTITPDADPRRPLPGTVLEREYKGQTIIVKVAEDGYDYNGRRYRSLSAIAKDITGTKWNGYLFFHLPVGSGNGDEKP